MAHVRPPRRGIWWSLIGIFAAGILLLSLRRFIPALAGWDRLNHSVQDLARDLGIAFVISTVVAGLFELYRSLHHQIQAMRDVIDAVMSDKLTKDVWFELEDLIDKKSVLRSGLRVRLEAFRNAELRPHEARLRVELEYVLVSIGRKRVPIRLSHDLDYHLASRKLNLPRFERITLLRKTSPPNPGFEEKIFEPSDLTESNKIGKFEISVDPLGAGDSLLVRIVREELVHIPGSYNLYTPEFTRGLRVLVAESPEDVRTEVWVRPQGEGKHLVPTGNEWWTDDLILPGQGVEVKFLRVQQATSCERQGEPETREPQV
jgi:hypothetical protein